ncbi:uncharacterized protein DUF1992 [Palleronia aestuarii]|uniref:Uncharacterized protein DUF1992 n=1 Tax=Palleronia aestuarii TaxID=568105 RepID=A0A2W7N9M1_9RHOB|nr:DUF1992 domain-containing protein [Palleronia aestuarii]PZX17115.1 uncharacterized protein DUF1992 [Palleronia aestuarii]
MSWLWRIAERRIEEAREAGDLTGLAGEGRPLDLGGAERGIDAIEAAGHRMMKAEGVVPPEVALRRKAAEQRAVLAATEDPEARKVAMAALSETMMRIAMMSERRRGLRG